MIGWVKGYRGVALVFWLLAITTILCFITRPSDRSGWDVRVYQKGIESLRAGSDPYADAMAVQREYYRHLEIHTRDPLPFSYVYSPITLPLLGAVGRLPPRVSGWAYWLLYAAGVLGVIWAGFQLVDESERKAVTMLAPAALFFPGLLMQDDVIFSGNVAYILYGAVFTAAVWGWRRGQWWLFYAAALGASCVKAPLLILLVIPLFTARRQWLPVCLTGAVGAALFALQPSVWPVLFRHYLEAVELQFSYNHDFGLSPAGMLAKALYYHVPYRVTSTAFYLFYAVPAFLALVYLSRKFFAGYFTLQRWAPVVMVGSVLLNPRIMEYDVAQVTVPMALIVWRLCARDVGWKRAALQMAAVFFVINAMAWRDWLIAECLVLPAVFTVGVWELMVAVREAERDTRDLSAAAVARG